MEKYCFGCGVLLQNSDKNKDGYTPKSLDDSNALLCERCFKLRHYGKFSEIKSGYDALAMINKSMKKDDLIVLIVDSCLIISPLIDKLDALNKYNNILVIATHYDLFKNIVTKERLYEFLNQEFLKKSFSLIDILIYDNNIDYLFECISKYSIDKDCYFVGLENVGKSTFIGSILKSFSEGDERITTSNYPGTTNDLIYIPFDSNYLIDTPGIFDSGNIYHYLPLNIIKRISNIKKYEALTYQLYDDSIIAVSNFLLISSSKRSNITLYFPTNLQVKRYGSKDSINNDMRFIKVRDLKLNDVNKLKDYNFKIKGVKDILISGLGIIRVKDTNIKISTYNDVNIFVRDSFIKGVVKHAKQER